ncbi:MAG: adenosylcobinamide-GDP ribazoletransferase [gamma proteobacterium symbiont of Taylorina sp.]|nr:adenosylcobinamide-GDP ribazoletransferase [gamma proteobacterium symbiont of Taylorina sp.]
MLRQQLNLFYIALGFLTRIPVPASIDYSQKNLNQASRYFSLVGWLIGFLCALIFWLGQLVLPAAIAILLSMLFSILHTGCFHEDGLADTCDGFGGGWEVQQKLTIMKDSTIGTYGASALWFTYTIKFALLFSLAELSIINTVFAMIAAHPVSRAVSTLMIFILPYVSDSKTSKVKPLAESQQMIDLLINLFIGAIALLLVDDILWIVLALAISTGLMHQLLLRQIGGFTGDTLGAVQQISELLIYLLVLISTGTIL